VLLKGDKSFCNFVPFLFGSVNYYHYFYNTLLNTIDMQELYDFLLVWLMAVGIVSISTLTILLIVENKNYKKLLKKLGIVK